MWGDAPVCPSLNQGGPGAFSGCFPVLCGRRVPVALTPARDPTRPSLAGTEEPRPRAVGAPEVRAPSWSADVRSQLPEELLGPGYASPVTGANRATGAPRAPRASTAPLPVRRLHRPSSAARAQSARRHPRRMSRRPTGRLAAPPRPLGLAAGPRPRDGRRRRPCRGLAAAAGAGGRPAASTRQTSSGERATAGWTCSGARASRARRPAGDGDLRRDARRPGRGRGRPRRHPHDLRTGDLVRRRRRRRCPGSSHRQACLGLLALSPAGRACTGAGCGERPTSTRSASSAPGRCGCCPCGETIPSRPGPPSARAGRPLPGPARTPPSCCGWRAGPPPPAGPQARGCACW